VASRGELPTDFCYQHAGELGAGGTVPNGEELSNQKAAKNMNKKDVFVTAINCIDGRVQLPVISYMKRKFKADYVDMVTAPGADKMLAEGIDKTLRRKVSVSVEAHGSKVVAVVGHYGCAGAPESKAEHLAHIKLGVECVKRWKLDVKIVGLWVNRAWKVEEVR